MQTAVRLDVHRLQSCCSPSDVPRLDPGAWCLELGELRSATRQALVARSRSGPITLMRLARAV